MFGKLSFERTDSVCEVNERDRGLANRSFPGAMLDSAKRVQYRFRSQVEHSALESMSRPRQRFHLILLARVLHFDEQTVAFFEEVTGHLLKHGVLTKTTPDGLVQIEYSSFASRSDRLCILGLGYARIRRAADTLDEADEHLPVDRLGQIGIHAGRQAALAIALHCVSCHGDNG